MIDAYKSAFGYAELKEGDTKHSADYKILTADEYKELRNRIRTLETKLQDEKDAHSADVKAASQKANNWISAYQKDMQDKLAGMQKTLDAWQQKVEDANALNTNLLRICKERANAARGLRPKKAHSGYVAKRSEQAVRVWYENKKRQEKPVWRTTIETPYQITLTEEQTRELIYTDIWKRAAIEISGNTCYTDFKMVKDMKTELWNVIIESEGEFIGVA